MKIPKFTDDQLEHYVDNIHRDMTGLEQQLAATIIEYRKQQRDEMPIHDFEKVRALIEASKDQHPTAVVEGDCLVLRVGVGIIAWAARQDNGGVLDLDEDIHPDKRHQFAKEIASEMMREGENGNSPFTDLLDRMIERAADSGSEAIRQKRYENHPDVRVV